MLPHPMVALATVGMDAVHLNRSSMALRPYHIMGNATIRRGGDAAHRRRSHRQHVPLLVLIFSVRANDARRAGQYRTWITHPWRAADGSPIPWRYVYVFGRKSRSAGPSAPDELIADRLVLGRVDETYLNLVHKTLDSLRWAVSSVSFDVLLKTDDDSMLHVSRLWAWLTVSEEVFSSADPADRADRSTPEARLGAWHRLYAGKVQINSQVIRANFTKKELWNPQWFPDDFLKWAIPYSSFGEDRYPPHCSGGGYLIGRGAAAVVLAQYREWRAEVFPIEDAFIGVLARAGGIVPTHLGSTGGRPSLFEDPAAQQVQVHALFAGKILVHRVKDFDRSFKWMLVNAMPPLRAGKRYGASGRGRGVVHQMVGPGRPQDLR